MKRIKRRIFAGPVCEQIVCNVSDRVMDIKTTKPRIRFKTEEERQKHKLEISRRRHARQFQANFSPTSIYSTLTFSDDYEIHTFREARRIRDNYCRRLLRAYPDAVIFIYMGRGKSTARIHFHMVSDGIPEEVIRQKWVAGTIIRTDHLREHNYFNGKDRGQDYSGLANYLFNHWTPEQGGHRWKQCGKVRKPEIEEPTFCIREYSESKPPRAPKGYTLVETKANQYGYLYFRYVATPPPRHPRKRTNQLIS